MARPTTTHAATTAITTPQGFVDVNQLTLQHTRFPNVFALGDSSSLPTSKTMAAITGQAPVLTHNLMRVMHGKTPTAEYDGFTSCPIVLGFDKCVRGGKGIDSNPFADLTMTIPMHPTRRAGCS